MPKRPQARSAAAGSDADAKKAKPYVFMSSHAITIPPNTEPESPKLSATESTKRAARLANADATSEEPYDWNDFGKFAEPFEAAVASAFAETGGPVSLTKVITKMTKMTRREPKIGDRMKKEFAWRGFLGGRWQISRSARRGGGLVAYPKGSTMPKDAKQLRFSPLPAAQLSCGLYCVLRNHPFSFEEPLASTYLRAARCVSSTARFRRLRTRSQIGSRSAL